MSDQHKNKISLSVGPAMKALTGIGKLTDQTNASWHLPQHHSGGPGPAQCPPTQGPPCASSPASCKFAGPCAVLQALPTPDKLIMYLSRSRKSFDFRSAMKSNDRLLLLHQPGRNLHRQDKLRRSCRQLQSTARSPELLTGKVKLKSIIPSSHSASKMEYVN